jgi:predicted TIM-barrel fold metal-dependent hydrolase
MTDTQKRWDLDDVFVLDSTVHGYNTLPDNIMPGIYKERVGVQLSNTLWEGHRRLVPANEPRWALSYDRFQHGADPDLLGRALFAESQTDVCIYHGVSLWGIYRDGGSPLHVGRAMRERWPDRVALYGPVSPWQPDAIDVIDRLVEEDKVVGIKLYPMDLIDGEIHGYRLDDPEVAYPIIEHARKRGVRIIATHKAIPQGQVPSEPFQICDVAGAASAFPDMTFEIVHGGMAYVEETAWQIQRFPNVVVNLEATSAYLLLRAPRRFAEVLGSLLAWNGGDRIFWSTGCIAHHPRPFIEMFWDFQIPDDMREGYGYPQLTDDIKRGILGLNHARILGWDVPALRARLRNDEFGRLPEMAPPWSGGAKAAA